LCTSRDPDHQVESPKLTHQKTSSLEVLTKTPFFELLASAVIVSFHALIAPKLRIASDALFVEGVTLSVVGGLIAVRVSENLSFPSLSKTQDEAAPPPTLGKHGLLTSMFRRRNGLRILLIGLALVGAAIVIGELFVRPAG